MKKEVKNIFNQSYQEHQSDVDPAAIWAGIEQQKKKKSKGFVWWIFGASFIVLGMLAFQFIGFGEGEKSMVSDSQKISSIENKENISSLSANKHKEIDTEATDTKATGIKATDTDKSIVTNNSLNAEPINKKATDLKGTNAAETKSTESIKQTAITNSASNTIGNAITNSETGIRKAQAPTASIKATVKPTTGAEKINSSETPIDKSPIQVLVLSSEINESKQANQDGISPAEVSISPSEGSSFEETQTNTINIIDLIPLEKAITLLNQNRQKESCYLNTNERKTTANNPIDSPSNIKSNKFAVTILGTAGLFKDAFLADKIDYITLRADSEQPLESFGAELGFTYQLKNIGINTGINYLRANRVVEWSDKYFGTQDGQAQYPYNPSQPAPNFIQQDSLVLYYFERGIKKYNETHTISIPLTLSYKTSIKKIDLGAYAGAAFHIFQKNNTDVLNTDQSLLDQRPDSFGINRRPDLLAGVLLDYKLNNTISITTRLNLRNRTTTEPDIKRQTNFYTLGLGLKYHF